MGDIGEVNPFAIAASSGNVPARVGLGGGMTFPVFPPVDDIVSPVGAPPEYRFGLGELVALLDWNGRLEDVPLGPATWVAPPRDESRRGGPGGGGAARDGRRVEGVLKSGELRGGDRNAEGGPPEADAIPYPCDGPGM